MTGAAADAKSLRVRYLSGVMFGLATVSIWSSWMAITRYAVTTSLTAYDITMLRFGTAGLLLLPVVIRNGLALDRLGWGRLLILICGGGAPYTLVATSGLRFAPVADAGVLIPGVMPLFVALLAALILKETFTPSQKAGYGLIIVGVLAIAGLTALLPQETRTIGHVLFLIAAFMWACYTIVLRQARLAPLHAAALVSVGSCVVFLPVYLLTQGLHLTEAPVTTILFQAGFQGVVATILALFFFGKTIAILGASAGTAFGALVPAMAALLAIPTLGEQPTLIDWVGILLVSVGVYLAVGGPWWGSRRISPKS